MGGHWIHTPQVAGVQHISWLGRVYGVGWRRKGQTHKRLAGRTEHGAKGIGEEVVEWEPINIGYMAPKNVVYDGLVVVTLGRGERQ